MAKKIKNQPIPLIVKNNTSKKSIEDNKKQKIYTTIEIVIVLSLLIINIILIIDIVRKSNNKIILENEVKIEYNDISNIGEWITNNNELFVFKDDNTFYWYNDSNNAKDNFYRGTLTYVKGLEALEEMGYTEEDFNDYLGDDVIVNNVYSIHLTPLYNFRDSKNVTEDTIKDTDVWWFILVIKNDGTAQGYNETLDIQYILRKN